MSFATPTLEDLEELLLACRYGDEDDLPYVKDFLNKFGSAGLVLAVDERGNTALHMAGGNGHLEITQLLLNSLPALSLITPNQSFSTPLHWIALNYHLSILKILCPLLTPAAYKILNGHGKSPVQEAEESCEAYLVEEGQEETARGKERIKREACIGYILEQMKLSTDEQIAQDTAERNKAAQLAELEKSVEGIELKESGSSGAQ